MRGRPLTPPGGDCVRLRRLLSITGDYGGLRAIAGDRPTSPVIARNRPLSPTIARNLTIPHNLQQSPVIAGNRPQSQAIARYRPWAISIFYLHTSGRENRRRGGPAMWNKLWKGADGKLLNCENQTKVGTCCGIATYRRCARTMTAKSKRRMSK